MLAPKKTTVPQHTFAQPKAKIAAIFMPYVIQLLEQKEQMLPLFPLIRQLTPNVSEERYAHMLDDMLAHGYRMLAVYEGAECVGLSGIWVATKIYSGRYLEMDNVVVAASHRSKGIGKLLCQEAEQLAEAEACETIMLDAYLENEKAHMLYERGGCQARLPFFEKMLIVAGIYRWVQWVKPFRSRFVAYRWFQNKHSADLKRRCAANEGAANLSAASQFLA